MAARPTDRSALTPAQRRAVAARGNVLVMAGAGTGKTHTLVERCLHCLCQETPPASLEEILVVTFTEAAAAEMRQRLRAQLEEKLRTAPAEPRWAEQLALFDAAHIGTLHSFCFKLVREHFHELGLDPQLAVLDEGEARLLADETLTGTLQVHYAGQDAGARAVQQLIQVYGGGRDQNIRRLVLQLHQYAQSRPDAEGWLDQQAEKFAGAEPVEWREWLLEAVGQWRDDWLPILEATSASANEKAAELAGILRRRPADFSRAAAAEMLEAVVAADGHWPAKRKMLLRKPLEKLFSEAAFLASLAPVRDGRDPLAEDWGWVRGHMQALVRLTRDFSDRFAKRKREDGVLDFHDLEQFTLKLLWDFAANQPTPTARRWRRKIRFVFVDEYQDINAAQDKIIQALSRDGTEANRFLVGDVKQSIYRFRLADPAIFREYARTWQRQNGQVIPLAENFRSREGLLNFVNSLFAPLLREEIGGVGYGDDARLQFGAPEQRAALGVAGDPSPRVELLLRLKSGRNDSEPGESGSAADLADLPDAEKEARRLALRLKELRVSRHEIWDGERKSFRAADWRDMAVLLRSPSGKAEVYAKEFGRAGVPLVVERGGFYDSREVLDLLSLLQLLDNPLQDVPVIAVLRSPLAGLALDELAQIRLAAGRHFWTALNRTQLADCGLPQETDEKIKIFLERFRQWRRLARESSLSQCLEDVLAVTHYADWLGAQPRGAQRRANVGRFLELAQQFDQFQRQGLFRFLKFIEAQRETGVEPEVAAAADENAVRLMSIHQSKGLEFPIVAVADLAKPFNLQDLRGEIIFDGTFGLCPRVRPPHTGRRYPSLPHWLAQRHQRREQWGEELRLWYVALTRARDSLILAGSVTRKNWETRWAEPAAITPQAIVAGNSCADWLGLWFAQTAGAQIGSAEGTLPLLRWRLADDAGLADPPAEQKVEALPASLDNATRQTLREKLSWEYPFTAATRRPAKASVTTLRRQAGETDDEAAQFFSSPRPAPVRRKTIRERLSAADTGTAHHKFLQFVALENTGDVATLARETKRLEQEGILTAEECAALDLAAVAAFWDSEPGRKIRRHPAQVRRELAFTARFSPAELEAITGVKSAPGLEDEFIVVQGVADLAVLLPEEIWLLDFKTDEISRGVLPEKTRFYAPQLLLYARALEKIYSRPVTARWLHFLAVNRTAAV